MSPPDCALTRLLRAEAREHRPVDTEYDLALKVCQTCQVVWPCTAHTRLDAALGLLEPARIVCQDYNTNPVLVVPLTEEHNPRNPEANPIGAAKSVPLTWPEACWFCPECHYTAWEGAVEDPGHITGHRSEDDEWCDTRLIRLVVTRAASLTGQEQT